MNFTFSNIPGHLPITITIPDRNYTNCHEFTRDVICELHTNRYITDLRFTDGFVNNIVRGDASSIRNEYNNVRQLPPIQNPNSITNISNGLLIFVQGNIVQHSMIVTDHFTWIGANNITSLGDAGSTQINNTGVRIYNNMHIRNAVIGLQGGWGAAGNIFASTTGEPYSLYFLPFF